MEEGARKSAEAEFKRQLDRATERAQSELIKSVALEAQYLFNELERINDLNEKDASKISLLYPIKGDQFGEHSTWKWQHAELLKWRSAYERLCEHCKRLNLRFGFWPLGTAIGYSALIRRLSDAGKGIFPIDSSEQF